MDYQCNSNAVGFIHVCLKSILLQPDLQIRGDIEDNSKIIFLISQCHSRRDSSNDGYNICCNGEMWLTIPNYPSYPSGALTTALQHFSLSGVIIKFLKVA